MAFKVLSAVLCFLRLLSNHFVELKLEFEREAEIVFGKTAGGTIAQCR